MGHAIGALWTELARGVSSVAPAALPASAFPSSESMNARPRNRTIPFSVSKTTKILALKKLVETKSGVKSSEQRILCRGRLVADDTSLSSAPVENNDVLLMVRKAPELVTATTPPGLRNDPHAPHNRGNGRVRSTARRVSRDDVVAVTATNAGGGSV